MVGACSRFRSATLTGWRSRRCVAALIGARVDSEGSAFNMLFRFVVTPMFLFSGTFYPISQLPAWGQWLAYVSPLWHGTELARGCCTRRHLSAGSAARAHRRTCCCWLVVGVAAGPLAVPGEAGRNDRPRSPATARREPATLLRMLPPGLYAGRGHVVLERAFRVYRRGWMVVFSGFFEPLFYLFALGAGLQPLVGTVDGAGRASAHATPPSSRRLCWPRRR